VISLDARPSDSIAIALRCAATLFADDSLLDHTDIEIAEGDVSPGLAVDVEVGDSAEASLNADQLKEHLRAMNPEDFGRFTL
jgi:bifunctional DNase/RNase